MNGKYKQGLIELKEAYRINNSFAPICNNIGFCLLRLNKPKEAIRYFQEAIQLEKTMVEAYYGLARTYRTLKQYNLALKVADYGLKINPKCENLLVIKAQILAEGFNDLQRAEELCLEALEISPSSNYVKNVLNWIRKQKR